MVIVGFVALEGSTCSGQDHFLKVQQQGVIRSHNLTLPTDNPWFFGDLHPGKYRFDTSVQLEPMNQNKVSPAENDKGFERKTLSLHFSLRG
jgi:hypothetical protein